MDMKESLEILVCERQTSLVSRGQCYFIEVLVCMNDYCFDVAISFES